MFSQGENTQKCALCNGTNFYLEAGFYFCSTCQTQNEDVREEVYDARYDPTTRVRKIKIRTEKQEKDIIGYTSWELYNFVLIGIANELIQIGVNPEIKLTILQLWTAYLTKLEVAFTSKYKKCLPKMARRYHKKDAEIIYGKIKQKKKKRQRSASNTSASSLITSGTSDRSASIRALNRSKRALMKAEHEKYLQSQASSDTDGFSSLNQSLYSLKSSVSLSSSTRVKIRFNKKAKLETKKIKNRSKLIPKAKRVQYRKSHNTTQYVTGPDVISPLKLWSIVYLALRINNENVYISDLLRFAREGHLSFYKLDHLVPSDETLTKSDLNILIQTIDITHEGFRRTAARMAQFLNIYELAKPDFLCLIKRYCEDLCLPRGVSLYAERLYLSAPSIMNFKSNSPCMPNYEARAIAYIIVVLKVLYGIDDITEKETSRVVEKINRLAQEKEVFNSKLFSFCEWQRYIECRKGVLVNVHYPSKIKYDPECIGTSHLYLRFMGMLKSKQNAELIEITNAKTTKSRNIVNAMRDCLDGLNDDTIPLKEIQLFEPSYTPLKSYITNLIENAHYDLPSILRINFYDTKVGYVTKPDSFIELASQCGIKLIVLDHSLKYLEKIVPPFEQPRLPTVEELKEPVTVKDRKTSINCSTSTSENLLDYSHRNRICKIKVNALYFKSFSLIFDKPPELEETLDLEEDSCFDKILPDGRLDIAIESDSDDDDNFNPVRKKEVNYNDTACLLDKDYCNKYNIKLYNHEIEAVTNTKKQVEYRKAMKEKSSVYRDVTGKFVKASPKNHRVKKEYKKVKPVCDDSSENELAPTGGSKKKLSEKKVQDATDNEVAGSPIDYIDLPDSDISILEDDDVIIEAENISVNEDEIFFRPFKNYWMYHCIFSRVKRKNFELFEKELPENFLWLLNECADIVEMTTDDLYEEVCLIEAFHLNVNKTKKSKDDDDYEFFNCHSNSYKNIIMNKW